ncbi:hypothetical protein SEA_LAHQTEMISH_55 [Microbacterium phage Lahqtemish]|uniref:hypothetical protein n=1 Tax=Microbacterium phage Lahqtemish TaxID=2776867 RepID=UPI0018A45CF2|nr:hypothetical protein QDW25_gp55 [Microbacterium phage Lahqtemish]QOP66646.1 hypothetical protein SEA_LAHQTEMISH_55 [Microbacterium phage Lahqtemish]
MTRSAPADPTASSRSHRLKGPAIDVEPRAKGLKTLADYHAAGLVSFKPVPPGWLVRRADGAQFSTPPTEAEAIRQADRIKGTYEWYVPVQATQLTVGETYDH